jgi:TonB family protein
MRGFFFFIFWVLICWRHAFCGPQMNADARGCFRMAVFVVVCATTAAQEGPPYRAGNGVSVPVVVQKTEPEYTEEAHLARVDGSVRISLVVDSEGNPTDLRVTRPIGFGLDEAALKSVGSWKFKPGVKDGVAVPVRTSIEVNFRLPEPKDALHMQSFVCKLSEGAARPRVLLSEHPSPPGPDETVSVTISMDVDEQGVPGNLHLVKLTEAGRENDVLAALREWRFQPGTATACTLSFAFGKMPVAPGAHQIGSGGSSPRPITRVEPEFSMEASRARYEGTVVLSVTVDDSGKVGDIKVLRPLGLGLDEKAIEAVRTWKFQPAMKGGQAMAVQATIEVNFRIQDKPGKPAWHMKCISFNPPAGAARPHVNSLKFPGSDADAAGSVVTVSFDIDEHGKPVNLHADKSSDAKWEGEVLGAVKGWKFDPGMKDGMPVAVPCTVTVAMGR